MSHHEAYRRRMDNHILEERFGKVETIRAGGEQPFANGFVVSHTAADIFDAHGDKTADALEAEGTRVVVAGRIRFFRRMGKACFVKIQDRTCRPGVKPGWEDQEPTDPFLQIFVSKGELGDDAFEMVKGFDLGDIVGVEGRLMRTRTGELSVFATSFQLLTKGVRPLPEKFKCLQDVEQRLRQRYVDLVMNDEVREVFHARAEVVRRTRAFLEARDYLEVETPMMHVTPGGAAARPFATHHNALDIDLYLRIAPELYLKRLLVGGFERVYELNRNFRNEGLSRQHNPEFTMLEFYQAYATYEDLMTLTEEMLSEIAEALHGCDDDGRITCSYQGERIDLSRPWRRVTVHAAVAEKLGVDEASLRERATLDAAARDAGLEEPEAMEQGKLVFTLFEELCEDDLVQPTFVIGYPASVSPLARRSDDDPDLCDRFELYVAGKEIANGFSELNDPEDQYVRFARQLELREAGDDEAMPMDEDYVRALEYGMPPAAGEGIGIDRLVMILTDSASIRDVILFPHMRPEAS